VLNHHHHHRDICDAPITVNEHNLHKCYICYGKIDKKVKATVARPNEHYMLD